MKRHEFLHVLVLSALILITSVSCASLPPGTESSAAEPAGGRTGKEYVDGRPVKKEIPGAIDFRVPRYSSLLDTRPVDGRQVFFAAVTRLYDREEEYEEVNPAGSVSDYFTHRFGGILVRLVSAPALSLSRTKSDRERQDHSPTRSQPFLSTDPQPST